MLFRVLLHAEDVLQDFLVLTITRVLFLPARTALLQQVCFQCFLSLVSPFILIFNYSSSGYATQCSVCPVGKECPHTTLAVQKSCVTGYYSTGGQSECTVCSAGHACDTSGLHIVPCDPGSYALEGKREFCLRFRFVDVPLLFKVMELALCVQPVTNVLLPQLRRRSLVWMGPTPL
jgi:hypothetical protein